MSNVLGYDLPDTEFNFYDINCLIDANNLARVRSSGNLFNKSYFEKAYIMGLNRVYPCIVDKTNNHVVGVIKNAECYVISDKTWRDLEEFEDWFNNL